MPTVISWKQVVGLALLIPAFIAQIAMLVVVWYAFVHYQRTGYHIKLDSISVNVLMQLLYVELNILIFLVLGFGLCLWGKLNQLGGSYKDSGSWPLP